ncbi:sigma-70 family RNA polymerase sigma factor [Ligilactobacillus aviarius]|uniref:sigma-70 family RNA polymerase sigma factor n=1 Tax=Ligilactobacillus aviarius TaxID=1606 RepID=UPI0024BA8FF1|nr:sigma-70 family RNA polymerase sigma factor [Ligilactobacillus aviarius]
MITVNYDKVCQDYSDTDIANGKCELSQVYNQYLPLVRSVCKRYYLHLYDTDDLQQEALIVCHKSIQRYNLDYKISFGAFYKLNLERHLCSLLRHEKSQKRMVDSIATSYEQYLEETANEICDQTTSYFSGIEATFLSKIDFIDTLIQLSAFEKSVLHLHLTTHKNTNEIATELNVKIEKIYCTFYQIKKKLRNKFVD